MSASTNLVTLPYKYEIEENQQFKMKKIQRLGNYSAYYSWNLVTLGKAANNIQNIRRLGNYSVYLSGSQQP